MIVKGLPKTRIAIEMGMSYDGLMRITRDSGYLTIEENVRKGVTDKMDARLDRRAAMECEVEDAVPEAMRILLDQVIQKRDLKAALEVLDRDPRRQFAKSRGGEAVNPLQSGPALTGDQLANAVRDADITHQILEKQHQPAVKPAEA